MNTHTDPRTLALVRQLEALATAQNNAARAMLTMPAPMPYRLDAMPLLVDACREALAHLKDRDLDTFNPARVRGILERALERAGAPT